MDNEGFGLQDLAGLVRRRAVLVGLTFLSIVLSAFIVAYSLEGLYKSSGVIIIEQREVSEKFLPGTFRDSNQEQRIERIYDEVMTRVNLAKIVEKHDLYAIDRGDGPPGSVVSELRKNFEMDFRLSSDDPRDRGSGHITGLVLSYFHPDPETARNVTRDIVNLFQERNRERRQTAYIETAAALEDESGILRNQVSELETQLAIFKSEHPGALPEDRTFNRQIIERKARDLDGLDREIRSLQERKTLLQSQIAQTELWVTRFGPDGEALPTSSERLRTLQSEYLRLLGTYSPNHPDVLRVKREIDSVSGGAVSPAFRYAVQAELNMTRNELADARRSYTTDHPDLQNLERSVAALEKQLREMPREAENLPPPNNPIYLNLEIQIQGVNNELFALRQDRTAMQQETRELDLKLQVAPEVERRYLELTRDLDLGRQQYRDSKSRLMSVQRAGILEEQELAERYVIARYPSLPFKLAFPNIPLFIVIGIFLGITIGLGTGILAEALDGSIRNTRDIRSILGMPPIVAIPEIYTAVDLKRIRFSRFMYSTTISMVVIAVAVYVRLQSTGAI